METPGPFSLSSKIDGVILLVIATILRRCLATGLFLGVAWFAAFILLSPIVAIAGVFALASFPTAVLALSLTLMRIFGRDELVSPPTLGELSNALKAETWAAWQVFAWWQPFPIRATSSLLGPTFKGLRGVVFVHGFFCNRGLWTPWIRRISDSARAYVVLDLEPPWCSVDLYSAQIDDAIRKVREASGMAPLVVCHSMGGLAVRAWLRETGRRDLVFHIVTIGTPHHGTWMGRFSRAENGRQMALSSSWLADLELQERGNCPGALFTCWYSNCDNIVFPASSATLPGADNRLVRGQPHVALAYNPEIISASLAKLDAI